MPSLERVVHIRPIITRHAGIEYEELGAGGGHGDLDQIHELELNDVATVGSLMELCQTRLKHKPELKDKVLAWLYKTVQQKASFVKVDITSFLEALYPGDEDHLADVPLDRLVLALQRLVEERPSNDLPKSNRIVWSLHMWFAIH